MLRALKLGISVADFELVEIGEVLAMYSELAKDYEDIDNEQSEPSVREATQADFDRF